MKTFLAWLLLLGNLTFVACKPPPPQTTPVTGLVTLDGQPCAGANVSFIPAGETRGNGGMGQTDQAGRFTAHLHDGKSAQGPPGLLPGIYKVLINKTVNPDGTPFIASADLAPIDANARELIPAAYSNYELTKLRAEIGTTAAELKFELHTNGK